MKKKLSFYEKYVYIGICKNHRKDVSYEKSSYCGVSIQIKDH